MNTTLIERARHVARAAMTNAPVSDTSPEDPELRRAHTLGAAAMLLEFLADALERAEAKAERRDTP